MKENQPQLCQDIALWFSSARRVRQGDPVPAEQVDGQRGRSVRYTLETTTALNDYLDWPDVEQAFCLRQVSRRPRSDSPKGKRFYGITSLSAEQASPDELLTLWREHWPIENGVHWVRERVFEEDRSRARTGTLAHALAIFRNLVMNMFRIYGYQSITTARTECSPDVDRALSLLA